MDEPVGPKQRLGFREVVRELGRVLLGIQAVELDERLRDVRMEAHTSREESSSARVSWISACVNW